MLSQQAVLRGAITEQGQAATISHGNGQARVNVAFPEVRIEKHMPHCSLPLHVGNAPVVANSIPTLALVVRERQTRSAHVSTMAGDQHGRMLTLSAKLIDDVG